MSYIKEHSWCAYLGFALPTFGPDMLQWQWWAIVVPTIILLSWAQS